MRRERQEEQSLSDLEREEASSGARGGSSETGWLIVPPYNCTAQSEGERTGVTDIPGLSVTLAAPTM